MDDVTKLKIQLQATEGRLSEEIIQNIMLRTQIISMQQPPKEKLKKAK